MGNYENSPFRPCFLGRGGAPSATALFSQILFLYELAQAQILYYFMHHKSWDFILSALHILCSKPHSDLYGLHLCGFSLHHDENNSMFDIKKTSGMPTSLKKIIAVEL